MTVYHYPVTHSECTFPILPVDSLGQSFHLPGVQPVLICNLISSSLGQETGNSRAENTKHVHIITITVTREKKTKPTKQKNQTQTVPRAMTISDTEEKWVLQMHCCPSFWVGRHGKNKAF